MSDMSALEELLAAASQDCTEKCRGACLAVACGPHCTTEHDDEPPCDACKTQREAEAALPRKRDMARAGQALAGRLGAVAKTWHRSVCDPSTLFECCPDSRCVSNRELVATWRALGEAKEGR